MTEIFKNDNNNIRNFEWIFFTCWWWSEEEEEEEASSSNINNGGFDLFFCDLFGDWKLLLLLEEEEKDGKILDNLFCLVLQKFFTSLSVLPCKYEAIVAHLFPNIACNSKTTFSSSAVNFHPLQKNNQIKLLKFGLGSNSLYKYLKRREGRLPRGESHHWNK